MFIVTNRRVDPEASGLDKLGKRPNEKGNNELRVVEAKRRGNGFAIDVLPDEISRSEAKAYIEEFSLDLDPEIQHYASLRVACELVRKLRAKKRHLLIFVHGYNNEIQDVLRAAFELEKKYNVEVLPFSWPANGGGVHGKLSYLSDKRDARASAGALERTLKMVHYFLMKISESSRETCRCKAFEKYPENAEKRDVLYAKLLRKECPFTINAMFHSMGNYLYKQMLKSTISEGNELIFDNVVLCQADTNNEGHAGWVDSIRHNRRVFITINENDYALRLSRIKPGDAQRARLGHFAKRLNSRIAYYVNLTSASWVQESHSPFGDPAKKNDRLAAFFEQAFSGLPAEEGLRYKEEGHWYELR